MISSGTQFLPLEYALKIVESALKIPEKPLVSIEIPIVSIEEWDSLGRHLKSRMEDDGTRPSEKELLVWVRGLTIHGNPVARDPQEKYEYDMLLMKGLSCGINTNAFHALAEMGEILGLESTNSKDEDISLLWLNHRFFMARLYKRQGEYLKAIELNRKVSEAISGKGNRIAEARALLHLAKAAYSHDMRAGMALTLSDIAISRLDEDGNSVYAIDGRKMWRARALDTKLGIEFDLLASISHGASKINRKRRTQMLQAWHEAEESDHSHDHLSMRTAFRRCRAAFKSSDSQEEKELLIRNYGDMLAATANRNYDIRGTSIRSGHYAEMLAAVDRNADAESYLESSIKYARMVCDWKTLSVNLMRLASIEADRAVTKTVGMDVAISRAKEAREVLRNLGEQPVDLHISHCQTLAKLYRVEGDWVGVVESLQDAESHLQKTLDRLNLESDEILFEKSNIEDEGRQKSRRYSPVRILSEQECGMVNQSIAVDWSIVAACQKRLVRELGSAVRFRQRVDSQKMSWGNLIRYGASIAHKIKNYHDKALRPFEALVGDPLLTDETRSFLMNAIEQYRKQFLSRIDQELSYDLSDDSPPTNHHSMRRLVRLHSHDMDDLRAITKDLEFHIMSNGQDFYVEGVETAIRLHLFFLFENAARAISESNCSEKRIQVTISWRGCEDGSREYSQAFGCVEIEDSAGRFDELRNAVEAVLKNKPFFRWHGLHLALLSFQADYGCEFAVDMKCQGSRKSTVLRIQFPAGARVRPG